jgi:hypothetical protein
MIQVFVPQLNRRWDVNDDYVEVWCVASATHMPCTHHSQDKVCDIEVFVALSVETPLYVQMVVDSCNNVQWYQTNEKYH